jgi:hypothetical protein
MSFMGWCVGRGENLRLEVHRDWLVFVLLVPTLTAWRLPRVVLWGATRAGDVQIGSAADSARQRVLNRRARLHVVMFRLRDRLTPVMHDMEVSFARLAEQTRPVVQSMTTLSEQLERARRENRRHIAEAVR